MSTQAVQYESRFSPRPITLRGLLADVGVIAVIWLIVAAAFMPHSTIRLVRQTPNDDTSALWVIPRFEGRALIIKYEWRAPAYWVRDNVPPPQFTDHFYFSNRIGHMKTVTTTNAGSVVDRTHALWLRRATVVPLAVATATLVSGLIVLRRLGLRRLRAWARRVRPSRTARSRPPSPAANGPSPGAASSGGRA